MWCFSQHSCTGAPVEMCFVFTTNVWFAGADEDGGAAATRNMMEEEPRQHPRGALDAPDETEFSEEG